MLRRFGLSAAVGVQNIQEINDILKTVVQYTTEKKLTLAVTFLHKQCAVRNRK